MKKLNLKLTLGIIKPDISQTPHALQMLNYNHKGRLCTLKETTKSKKCLKHSSCPKNHLPFTLVGLKEREIGSQPDTPNGGKVVRSMIDNEGLLVVRYKKMLLTRKEVELFYIEHKNKFFYGRLVTFMASGPLHVFILSHENAIEKWRKLLGPTKVFRAHFDASKSIRGIVGLSDTRNSAHGSDSVETASKEINFFFPEFSIDDWIRNGRPIISLKECLSSWRK